MEKKKEINLEEFMASSWSRLKQLIFAQSENIKDTEGTVDKEIYTRDAEEIDDLDDNEDESEHVEDVVKYTEPDELDDSQYDDITKLLVKGII